MSFLTILYTILIQPLQLLFEFIYSLAYRVTWNPGTSIIVLSLAINFLVLPLYKRADAMQEEERNMEMKLAKGVSHIKKTFRGDERMMMLQTYYRQNNYKPTYVLRGATSLFLEIPFFIAAYRFLSNLPLLEGVSYGPIANLAVPDALISIGGISINILPVLMTFFNIISTIIYTRNCPLKTKLQLYIMAAFFLVFLYDSPSGLVFYWTLNNVFSLLKNVVYQIVKIRSVKEFLERQAAKKKPLNVQPSVKSFLAAALFLTVLTGLLIPSAVIGSSAQEFADIKYFYHPVWYIVTTGCLAAGTWFVYLGVFYWLASSKGRVIYERVLWGISIAAVVNYMFFGTSLGMLSSSLKYENGLDFAVNEQVINACVIAGLVAVAVFICVKWRKFTTQVLVIASLAVAGMAIYNIAGINSSIKELETSVAQSDEDEDTPKLTLSKTGKNVIVFMLDRGMGEYLPYIFNEKPELKEQFSGFTAYTNVISFGGYTNFGTPSLFGGYEYTPIELNARSTESLKSKQNEALKVMPSMFDINGYNVTVCDPTYANYQWVPDLSIYDDYPDIQTYITKGEFTSDEERQNLVDSRKHNFFYYSLMKCSPLFIQYLFYDNGTYNMEYASASMSDQTITSLTTSSGEKQEFLEAYSVLESLSEFTFTSEDEDSDGSFIMITNDTTHDPMMLQEPAYEPAARVDNTEYEAENEARFTVDGKTLIMEDENQVIHYQANMASMIKLGEWFDYLKEQGVYDNTRIIIVSDHGRDTEQNEDLILEDGTDVESFYPVLMVKDFDAEDFSFSDEFMTNADVPTLAMEGLIEDMTNPFTGNEIDNSEKTAHDQYIIKSDNWSTARNHGNTFKAGDWYSVHDNIWDQANWSLVAKNAVLDEYK